MKKLLAILIVMVLMFAIASPALADEETTADKLYRGCCTMYDAHRPASEYAGTRVDALPKGGFKTVTITSDAGFVSLMLSSVGLGNGLMTRNELRAAVTPVTTVADGAILFKYYAGTITTVGLYVNGYQFYIKNGYVAMEKFVQKSWVTIGLIP